MVVIYNLVNFVNRVLYWFHRRVRNPRQLLLILLSTSLLTWLFWKLYSTDRFSIPRWHSINSANALPLDKLNIAVVEEHHEALPYWFAAADKGIIRKHGNTLIHIDSHSDLNLLSYDNHMPWFRFPDSATQIASLMQANDQFITGAMMTGLVTDMLWVFPDWVTPTIYGDSDIHRWEDGAFTDKISIGWYTYNGKAALCYCFKSDRQCEYRDGGIEVKSSEECPHMIAVKLTLVKASMARPLLEKATKTSYILDLDEDFYGVARGSDMLTNIEWWRVEELDSILGDIFQPQSVYEEVAAHDIMKDVLHQILRVCLSNEAKERRCTIDHVSYINKYLAESGHFNRPIGGSVLYTLKISALIHDITKLVTDDQIRILQRVGFCLAISPNTWQLPDNDNSRPALAVCHGRNVPDTTNQIQVFHELTQSKRVMDDLIRIVSAASRPGVVTVARSNRDGYVPRHQQTEIETSLLSTLTSNFRQTNIVYDPSIMTHLGQNIVTV